MTELTNGLSALLALSAEQQVESMRRTNPGVWAEDRLGYVNADFHWEWYGLAKHASRLAVIAPREHAKSEVFAVNMTAWRSIYQSGIWTYVFTSTLDQAKAIKARIDATLLATEAWMVQDAHVMSAEVSVYANWSKVTVAGSGKRVRGAHPDIIIGDDVLDEESALTSYQRAKIERWWLGTVSGMAHPGTTRIVGGLRKGFPPTRVVLVGTPFHSQDLLMSMKSNPLYTYRRYSAEYEPSELHLKDSLAVEYS
ncbi:MAG: hypothetical protein M3529_11070 [Actinomycetota bacterium]|nr:hypothetical protein [Actinomycetota bacterium]